MAFKILDLFVSIKEWMMFSWFIIFDFLSCFDFFVWNVFGSSFGKCFKYFVPSEVEFIEVGNIIDFSMELL